MSLISSTTDKVLAITVVALTGACIAFGGLYVYRGTVIDKQNVELAKQKEALDAYAKDKAAQEEVDKQLAKDKEKIATERDNYKKRLSDALKGNKCTDEPLPDNAKRVLNDLYHSKGS